MTGEFRSVLFHVRERLTQVQQTLLQDEDAALRPMTIGEAVCYLKQAINLELARPEATGKPTTWDAARSDRGRQALRAYAEARGEQSNDPRSQIPELIADLLHLAVEMNKGPDAVDRTLRRAQACLVREQCPANGERA